MSSSLQIASEDQFTKNLGNSQLAEFCWIFVIRKFLQYYTTIFILFTMPFSWILNALDWRKIIYPTFVRLFGHFICELQTLRCESQLACMHLSLHCICFYLSLCLIYFNLFLFFISLYHSLFLTSFNPLQAEAAPLLATFLRKNHRALKLSTLTCLDTLVMNYGDY